MVERNSGTYSHCDQAKTNAFHSMCSIDQELTYTRVYVPNTKKKCFLPASF